MSSRPDGNDRYQRLLEDRERFVAFAFSSAELLIEATSGGRVVFAAGAFRSRLGLDPVALFGRPAATVVTPEDGSAFATCLALLAERGRLAPTTVRLANAERTTVVLSGLTRPSPDGAALLCLSLGTPPGPQPKMARTACTADTLGREAEARLRAARGDGGSPVLDLLEVEGTASTATDMEIASALLQRASVGTMVSALAPHRYGLLRGSGATEPRLAEVIAELQAGLRSKGIDAKVAAAERLALSGPDTDDLTTAQAVRALRYALSSFARGGVKALTVAGLDRGLGSFVATTEACAGALRRIFADRRFTLAFQPIVQLQDRAVHHYEALLRPFRVPGIPAGDPNELVVMAEMLGLAEDLDGAVFEAVREAASRSGAAVAFNISGLSAQSPTFRKRLMAALARPMAASPSSLLAEVTETAEIEDETQAAETIATLRESGVPVCIDDFGAGAAAFRYLHSFQVDYVKIDGTYVRHAVESERDRSFVAAMVDLSLKVGAQAISEQVENEAVATIMSALGVRYGQGWLFGRPGELPAPKVFTGRRRGTKETWE